MKSRSRSARIAAQLADLKMPGALEALDEVLAGVDSGGTTAAEAVERLLAAQITLRNSRRLAPAMRSSRLPAIKTLEDFDFSFQPSVKREQIDSLHELGFLERKENVVFLGPPGVGKTHLAISLAITAAESGRRVYYGTLTDLIDSLEEAQAAGRLNHRLKTLTHPALLVVDEIGYLPVTRSGASPVLPAHQPPLRARFDRGHLEQGLRAVGGDPATTRSWPPPCWTGCSTAATSSISGATATGCGATWNSPRPSTQRLPGPSPRARREQRNRIMMGVRTPSGAPAPVAPLPPRGLPRSVHFSMARSVHFSMAIDTARHQQGPLWVTTGR